MTNATAFIYVDQNNGCMISTEREAAGSGLNVVHCETYEDVDRELTGMTVFEQFLKVPASLVSTIDKEYGITAA